MADLTSVRSSRSLVSAMILFAVLAVSAAGALIGVVLPGFVDASEEAKREHENADRVSTLLSRQSAEQRGYLLSGDALYIQRFDSRAAELDAAVADLRQVDTAAERVAIERFVQSYQAFSEDHDRIVAEVRAGHTAEAIAIDLGPGRAARVLAEAQLDTVKNVIGDESRAELTKARRQATTLTALLVALGFAPAVAALALGRNRRELAVQRAAAVERSQLAEAQRVAHLGSWEHVFESGQTTWSDEMYRLFGYG
ncbi:MAG TPA: CHASE3 domain-containing protein, partial [Acidimicrobiales bacterium]|nr:CHASE3 domain-containing protein [Acidimicrobiales bacterium]